MSRIDKILEYNRKREDELWTTIAPCTPDEYKVLIKERDQLQAKLDRVCEWKLDANEHYEIWETSCGASWSFTESNDLEHHGIKFCHKCGDKVATRHTA